MGRWKSGKVEKWKSGKVGNRGKVGRWKGGNVAKWKSGKVGQWEGGKVGRWKRVKVNVKVKGVMYFIQVESQKKENVIYLKRGGGFTNERERSI